MLIDLFDIDFLYTHSKAIENINKEKPAFA